MAERPATKSCQEKSPGRIHAKSAIATDFFKRVPFYFAMSEIASSSQILGENAIKGVILYSYIYTSIPDPEQVLMEIHIPAIFLTEQLLL